MSPTGDYKYVAAAGLFANRPFRIISKLPSGRLMSVQGSNVVVKDRSKDMSQVWMYVERNSCIKSQSNRKCMDLAGGNMRDGTTLLVW